MPNKTASRDSIRGTLQYCNLGGTLFGFLISWAADAETMWSRGLKLSTPTILLWTCCNQLCRAACNLYSDRFGVNCVGI